MKLLKSSLAGLSSSLPLIKHMAPTQVVERLRGSGLQALKKRVLARCGSLCECPACQAGYPIKLTWATCELDHMVPLYQGGTNAIANMRALHVDCHRRITDQQAAERATLRRSWGHAVPVPVPPSPMPRRLDDDEMAC